MIEIFHSLEFLEFFNELGKISSGENGMNPLGVMPMPQNIWPEGPEDIHF